MEVWNQLINSALLGTGKSELNQIEYPAALIPAVSLVDAQQQDRADSFLQKAALVYNFRQCGVVPVHNEQATLTKAPPEEKEYADAAAHQVLLDVMDTGSVSLLRLWLQHCQRNNLVVEPEFIPLLLEIATKTVELKELVRICCGKRGSWLAAFNPDWNSARVMEQDDAWSSGTLEQRKEFLRKLRAEDPAKARTLLQEVWTSENANARVELLKQLSENISGEDLNLLETLLQDKSQKVRDEALRLLKRIPSSSIVQQYWEILRSSVVISHSKGIFGISPKMSLEIKPVSDINESVYKSGIEKLSSEKKVSDEQFVIFQLLSSVPPQFWLEHFQLSAPEIINLFNKDVKTRYYLPAFGKAAALFGDVDWLRAIISVHKDILYPEAFFLLPQKEAEAYAAGFLNQEQWYMIMEHLTSMEEEWSPETAVRVIALAAKNPWQFNRGFFNQQIHLFPTAVINEFDRQVPVEDHLKSAWSNAADHAKKLLEIKSKIIKTFNE